MTCRGEGQRFLSVGLVCIDIINVSPNYPEEDKKARLEDAYIQVGGNAANTASVLAILGAPCDFFGLLGDDSYEPMIRSHFEKYRVNYDLCIHQINTPTPASTVLINSHTGSRTILHYRGSMREITCKDFTDSIKLDKYRWVHFEGGRLPDETLKEIEQIHVYNQTEAEGKVKVIVSVELEKPREEMNVLLKAKADYFFISKEFAEFHNSYSKEDAVEKFLKPMENNASVVCAWGTDGAAAQRKGEDLVTSVIFPPDKVVDTLGAGDSFVAGTINSLFNGETLQESIVNGCKVAGRKVGGKGLSSLVA